MGYPFKVLEAKYPDHILSLRIFRLQEVVRYPNLGWTYVSNVTMTIMTKIQVQHAFVSMAVGNPFFFLYQ